MPLIDLKTNLTSLKYGKDQPSAGWSGQPYIQTPQISIGNNYPDFPMRGGQSIDIGSLTASKYGQIDKDRIQKFLQDKKRGPLFLAKQAGLQLSNPKIETGNSLYNLDGTNAIPGILSNTRVYNAGKNTLVQVGLMGTGVHIPRHGAVPIQPTAKYYSDIVGSQKFLGVEANKQNRLVILQDLKMRTATKTTIVAQSLGGNIQKINELGISTNRNLLFQYLGGPGSVYGIGTTTIKRTTDTTSAYKDPITKKPYKFSSGSFASSYDSIMSASLWKNLPLENKKDLESNLGFSYKTIIATDKKIIRFPFDKLNSQAVVKQEYGDIDPFAENKDIIKFGFELLNNDGESNLFLQMRAYLVSGLSDANSSALSSFKYIGRGEDFYTYQGFSRTISFSLRVVVLSENDMQVVYDKVNYLASQVYPDYSVNGFMRAPVVKLTIGDYLYRVPGMLERCDITVPQDSSWEISEDIGQLPHYIDLSLTFKPIPNSLPRRKMDDNGYDVISTRKARVVPEEPSLSRKPLSFEPVKLVTNQSEDIISIFGNKISPKVLVMNPDILSTRSNIDGKIGTVENPLNTTKASSLPVQKFSRVNAIVEAKTGYEHIKEAEFNSNKQIG